MPRQRDLYLLLLQISEKLGADTVASPSENLLRSIYVVGTADKNELDKTLSDLTDEINGISTKVDGSTIPPLQKLPDAVSSLSSINTKFGSELNSAFSLLNSVASLLFKEYSADGKLSTLVQDLQDLASRSEALKSFLQSIRIPHLTFHRLLYFLGSPNADINVLNAYSLNLGLVTHYNGVDHGLGCDSFKTYYCQPFKLNIQMGWIGGSTGASAWLYVGDYIAKDSSGNIWVSSRQYVMFTTSSAYGCVQCLCQGVLFGENIDSNYAKNSLFVSLNQGAKHATITLNPGDTGKALRTGYSCGCEPVYDYAIIVLDDTTFYLTALDLLNNLI